MLIDTQCVDNSKLTKLRPTTIDNTRIKNVLKIVLVTVSLTGVFHQYIFFLQN